MRTYPNLSHPFHTGGVGARSQFVYLEHTVHTVGAAL